MALATIVLAALAWVQPARAFDLAGTKDITLVTRDGTTIPMGTVDFAPDGATTKFALHVDLSKFQEFFLSMREFKCVAGPEIECYVPYPYANPSTVTPTDLSWLEHALLFFYKDPNAYGAKLSNGLIYTMTVTNHGIVGTPAAIDLDAIASPPDNLAVPPFGKDARDAIADGTRWISRLEITDPKPN